MPPKDKTAASAVDKTSAAAADASSTEDQRRAAAKRAAALGSPDQNAGMIAALLEERRGYVIRGMDDRVKQVDEQLRLRGAEPPTGD